MSLFKSKSEREAIKQAKIEKLEVKIANYDAKIVENNAQKDAKIAENNAQKDARFAEIDAKTQAKKDRLDAEIAQLNKERKELLALRKKKK